MSWYNTVVLSFSCDEFEDEEDESCRDCKPLQKINAWLKQQRYEPLLDISQSLGSNAVLFGGCFNKLDVDKFSSLVAKQKWRSIANVQILFWDDNDSRFSVIDFGATT